ncbi:hypothetical protein HYQ46_006316 [Verticillium longisporum]|nr:hypothetical protein HYQ46_006316 [Verticillium longisporum]
MEQVAKSMCGRLLAVWFEAAERKIVVFCRRAEMRSTRWPSPVTKAIECASTRYSSAFCSDSTKLKPALSLASFCSVAARARDFLAGGEVAAALSAACLPPCGPAR